MDSTCLIVLERIGHLKYSIRIDMNLTIVGTGYVGLVSRACFARFVLGVIYVMSAVAAEISARMFSFPITR